MGKVIWASLNFLNNFFPNIGVDKKIIRCKFKIKNPADFINQTNLSSPSRWLSDRFWQTLDWSALKRDLGEINILDIGCGSGNYGTRFLDWSQGKVNKYTGLDIKEHPNWSKLKQQSNFSFQKFSGQSIMDCLPEDTNVIVSQSALEHIPTDWLFLKEIRDHLQKTKKRLVQIHLMPAKACLPLYIPHGIRQYTPRTVSKFTKLFNDFSQVALFDLGGPKCNDLHWDFITKQLLLGKTDRRDTETELYNTKLLEAVNSDNNKQSRPAFYALVIYSYPGSNFDLNSYGS